MPHRDKEMQRIAFTLTANWNTLSYVHYNITDIFWIRIHGKRKIHFELWKLMISTESFTFFCISLL